MGKSDLSRDDSSIFNSLPYEDLVEIVRGLGRNKRKNNAYNAIENRIRPKVLYISRQFYIPGLNFDDIVQESLYALRFKAIPDYNKDKGYGDKPYPFDRFAILCIRRHLSTILKSSFQNKKRALNTSISLDQDRGSHEDENMFLSDILPTTDLTVVEFLGGKEYYKNLFKQLFEKLSKLEKSVFALYTHRYSYDEITDKLNNIYKKKGYKRTVNIKSVDNALSRIKIKAKEIYMKHGDD